MTKYNHLIGLRFTAFSYAGSAFGTVISMPLCSYLCESVGWDSVFYVFGALGILWFVVWALLVHDGPEIHPRISDEEKEYLQASLTECEAEKPARIPWMRRGLSQSHICYYNIYYIIIL